MNGITDKIGQEYQKTDSSRENITTDKFYFVNFKDFCHETSQQEFSPGLTLKGRCKCCPNIVQYFPKGAEVKMEISIQYEKCNMCNSQIRLINCVFFKCNYSITGNICDSKEPYSLPNLSADSAITFDTADGMNFINWDDLRITIPKPESSKKHEIKPITTTPYWMIGAISVLAIGAFTVFARFKK